MRREFLRNYLNVDVDGFTCTVRYVVRAMYDVIDEDGGGTIEQEVVEDVTLTIEEIEKEGGHANIIEQLKECYAPLCCH